MNDYQKLARYYDRMKSFPDIKKHFFQSIFSHYDNPSILDCACGTGYELEVFYNMGYKVTGSDLSNDMLGVANERLKGKDIRLNQIDFQELDKYYEEGFDIILCLSNSINEIHVDPIKALKSMSSVLYSNGVIIFNQKQSDASMKNPPRNELIVDDPDFKRTMTLNYYKDIMGVTINDTINRNTNYSELIQTIINIKIRLLNDWIKILDQCNLSGTYYGDWNQNTYDINTSMRLIIVAKKND